MAALADDGIPGGPGIYSTRCPPLPRLRMKESREVVHRATLKARGIDPDSAPPGSRGSRPVSKSGSRKGTPGNAMSAGNMMELFGNLEMSPLPKLNRLGGGGGGDFETGVGADRYLKVSYEARKMRETRKRELAKAGLGSPGKEGGDDDNESIISMSDDRAAEAAAKWTKAREEQTATLHHATQAYNSVTNLRREREATLAKLELELDHLASTGEPDFSDLEQRVEKLKLNYKAQLEQSEEEAERKHPIYLQIANRLREGNLELKQGVESLKDVIKDVQADHDSCKEYERAALEAQKKGSAALEWIHGRYLAKVEGWKTELEKTRQEREQLAEDIKQERAEDREFQKKMEQSKLQREAKSKTMKRIAAGMLHEVEEKEMAEEVSRGHLSQLAITVGLDNPENCTPDEIVNALKKSRETKDKVSKQISDLQEKEAELWKKIMKEKEALQQARLGLSQRMQARMSAAGAPRMSMSITSPRQSRGLPSSDGLDGEGMSMRATSRISEAEVDLATSRESYMDEVLLGKEKVLMSIFRNFNNALVVLATFDEGLRAINSMVDTVVEAPKRSRAAAAKAAREAAKQESDNPKPSLNRRNSQSRESFSGGSLNRASRTSVSSVGFETPRASENATTVGFEEETHPDVDITPLTSLFQTNSEKGRSDVLAQYQRLPDLVEATLTRLLDIMKHLPKEGRAARISVVLGTPSMASGGKGIPVDHPLAGTGHKLGKVSAAVSEVDYDPSGMSAKTGKEYKEQVKKWCYTAGPPVDSEDDEDEVEDSGVSATMGKVGTKLSSVSQFRRIGRGNRADPDAPMEVVRRDDLKHESAKAKAKIDKAKPPAFAEGTPGKAD